MKFTFDETKINVFTLIPYGKMREDIVIKKCIESWKKIPNSVIYLFDIQDIKDTFPGMVENDKYYKILNNEYLKPGEEPTEKVPLYGPEHWCPETTYKISDYIIKKEQNLSTDILRLKILQEIPNSIYMDSDMYIINEKAFMDLLYDDKVRCYKNYLLPACSFVVKKGKERSFVIDEFIKHYDNLNDMIVYDHVAWSIFSLTFKTKYGSNKTKIKEFNLFDNPYQARNDINGNLDKYCSSVYPLYVIHLFSLKYLMRQSKIRGIDFSNENVINFNILCFDIRNDISKFRSLSNNKSIVDIYLKMININRLSTDKSMLLTDMIVLFTNNEGSNIKNLIDLNNINNFNDVSEMICFENFFELYTYYKCEKNIDVFKQILKDNIIYNIVGIDKRCKIEFNFYEIDNAVKNISKIQ